MNARFKCSFSYRALCNNCEHTFYTNRTDVKCPECKSEDLFFERMSDRTLTSRVMKRLRDLVLR